MASRRNRSILIFLAALLLGALPREGGAHTQAEKTFYLQSRIVLRLNPSDATAGNAVGTWHLEYNQREQAARAFASVLRQHAEDFVAPAGLALIAEIDGKYDSALRRVEAIRAHPPGFAPFLKLVRGRLQFKAGRHEQAERLLREGLTMVLERKQNPHDYYFWLGRIREASGRPDEAIAYFRKAIAADPFWAEPYSRISLIHQHRGEREKAARVLREIVGLDNPSPYPNNDIMVLWNWVMRTQTGGK